MAGWFWLLALGIIVFAILNNVSTVQNIATSLNPQNQTLSPQQLAQKTIDVGSQNIVMPLWLLGLIIFMIILLR